MTNQGFLQVVGRLSDAVKANWQLVADEAFNVWQWSSIYLGAHREMRDKNLEHFHQLFIWDDQEDRFPQLKPQPGAFDTIQAAARRDERTAGTAAMAYAELAAHVINPATSTELVQKSEASIEVANVIQAEAFSGFDSVTIMAAEFETHPLYTFWSAQGVAFLRHQGISQYIDGDMAESQGPYLMFGHLLPSGEEGSKTNCQRDAYTGQKSTKQNPVPAERTALVVALQRFATWAQDVDPAAAIVLVTSPGVSPERNVVPYIDHPAIKHAGCDLRGLNEYRGHTIMANVPCNNPTPQQTTWTQDRLGVSAVRARELMRYPTIMQATGRLTRDKGCTKRKLVVTLSERDAWKSHQQYPGSTWMGQMVELQRPNKRQSGRPQGSHKDNKLSRHPDWPSIDRELKRIRAKKQRGTAGPDDLAQERALLGRKSQIRREMAETV